MILLARPLRTGELERLHRHRYVVVPDWLTRAQTGRLQADAVAVGADSGFESAVGSVNFGTARVDTEVRRSRQCSIYPPPRNAAGSVTERDGLVSAVNGLRRELEAAALPALPRLAPFETELNYLLYPIGGHYKRHLDQPRGNSGWQRQGRRAADGGSISGGSLRRVVSFILYLNDEWEDADGGVRRGRGAERRHARPPHERRVLRWSTE
ncbi:hypothetical protein EMIHUDRAFT_445922 [Emiliania huxleyi CCMP1516]|uniref:Prolyl 4-hydroxylase alpha subunit Fe(2+) 2OG dioxygenase domain-containing protein n=2 Tax=Emiliania huxleyi TaxID=2903 RepID=A0A0D3IP61_EMIH1|nr:hypothetical protein EMIHUDRAFT_445922 [Emiliania huxleyi CCMP1516]EOD13046.1 hypothetical protein EMIHUDRAFT_445922 [Emiliania huxleyi CCMP1516]|eukprot:XP_005765475.1 hypothetical protein EMIHUDRAFT_445922 [Emiliania huxleyi CCMP1516]